MVVAPLDANTLAKFTSGICDNLLTCTMRAWDPVKPMFLCPAMNTFMWQHPITLQQLDIISKWSQSYYGNNLILIEPVPKQLMCGDVGQGAMASTADIAVRVAKTAIASTKSHADIC